MKAQRRIGIERFGYRAACLAVAVVWGLCGCLSVVAVQAAGTQYNLYFGDLHTHTGYSDSYVLDSTPAQAFAMAIEAGADFMAVTEHRSTSNAYEAWTMSDEDWLKLRQTAAAYTSEHFVAMPGYEFYLVAHSGEINVYNTAEIPEFMTIKGPTRLADFYDWLSQRPGAIGQFNHPLYVGDNFKDFAFHTEARDAGMNVLEVYNGEFTEESYLMALDAGWHLMPSANSDTHYDDWIAGHEMRTVLLAEKLTPEDLYDAMRRRRGYATMDKNLCIFFTLDGEVMGTVLAKKTRSHTARVQVWDPDAIAGDENDAVTLLEIVTAGGEVAAGLSLEKGASRQSIDWKVTDLPGDAGYYYVRVSTASNDVTGEAGVTAWTAPVWTGR